MNDKTDLPNLPPIGVIAQYVKDLSFEVPGAPQIFSEFDNEPPDVNISVDLDSTNIANNRYEVMLKLNVDAKFGDKTVFVIELIYCGLFAINVQEEHLQPVLMIECPRLLFPFARMIISNITSEANLPPLNIQPVDFVSMFRRRLNLVAESSE